MAYSTVSSTAISVTNFGVRLDGVTNNRDALQSAVNSLYPTRGGTLYFPAGTCYWSGTVDITGRDIRWVGDGDAVLRAAPNEAAKKVNISGARNVSFAGLTLDGGRTGGTTHTSNQLGFVSTINSQNISVTNCQLVNTLNSLVYLGGGTRFVNISDNDISGHFCGVYSYVNAGETGSECFVIDNNRFGASWCSGDIAESACIKLQTNPFQSAVTRGHVVSNNVIDSPMQMGIELWSRGRSNTVVGNTIENTVWGISLDGQENCAIASNTIKATEYAGIELASACRYNSVVGNSINGYTTTGDVNTARITNYAIVLSNTACEYNTISDNVVFGAGYGLFVQNARNTIASSNIIRDCEISLNVQAASLLQFHDNLLETGAFGTQYHVFFDASNVPLSGFHLSDNKFRGATLQQSIFYYNNGTSNLAQDVCIENNITDETTSGNYNTFIGGQFTPANYVYRNNFGPSGIAPYNTILDSSDTPNPYQSSAIQDGYQFYSTSTITIPGSGVPYSSGAWVNIGSGDCNGNIRNVRYTIKSDVATPPYTYDNRNENLEIYASVAPYNLDSLSIMVSPQASYNGNIVKEVWVDNPGGDVLGTVWVNLRSGSIATSGYRLTVYGSDGWLISNPAVQFQRPAFSALAVGLDLDLYSKSMLKTTRGVQIGDSAVFSPRNGTLVISGQDGISLANATEISGIRSLDPVLNVTNLGDFTYLDVADFNAPNLSVGNVAYVGIGRARSTNNQFSAGMYYAGAGSSSNRLDFGAYGGSPILSVRADSRVGVNTTNPAYTLHVNGSFGLSGIATEMSANAGPATALPATPAGYVTINITGAPFKVPYYNI